MSTRTGLILVLSLTLLTAGCTPRTVLNRSNSSDRLTGEMLRRYSTVGEAIQALRSGWLVQRSPSAPGLAFRSPVWVYRDGTRVGDADVLTYLSVAEVSSVDYIDAARASFRWGTNHENGVIFLTSR